MGRGAPPDRAPGPAHANRGGSCGDRHCDRIGCRPSGGLARDQRAGAASNLRFRQARTRTRARTGARAGTTATTRADHGIMSREALTWQALGTYVHLAGDHRLLSAAAKQTAAVLAEVDLACSRFRVDSELSLANAAAGTEVSVSPLLAGALQVALEAARITDGLLDPTIGSQVVAAGYDRTFALVPSDAPDPVRLPPRHISWREVSLSGALLQAPQGTQLDVGATGKAYAADLVAAVLDQEFEESFLVSLGGDLRISRPSAQAYTVAIGHRIGEPALRSIQVHGGAIATSSRSARSWTRGGRTWHHIIDPRTGRSADGPWQTVTAYGHTAVAANTASTTALILGDAAYDWLVARDVAACLIDDNDELTTTPLWDKAFGGECL